MVSERKFKTFNCNRQILYMAAMYVVSIFIYCVITMCIYTIIDIFKLSAICVPVFMAFVILLDYATKQYVYKYKLNKSVLDASIPTSMVGVIIGSIIGSVKIVDSTLFMLIACWAISTYAHIWGLRVNDNLDSVYTVYTEDCLNSVLEGDYGYGNKKNVNV